MASVGLAFGVLMIFVGAALLWVATHGTEATTPWGLYDEIIQGIRHGSA